MQNEYAAARKKVDEPSEMTEYQESVSMQHIVNESETRIHELETELQRLRSFATWLVALDEPDNTERQTVTLTQLIEMAREALSEK